MRCDSQASLLARTLASPYFDCEPKAKVTTCGLNKIIKFVCNAFVWVLQHNLIVQFYKITKKKSNLVAIPSFGSLQHHFQELQSCKFW
jgi:hypothetical protein